MAGLLGVSDDTVRRWAEAERLPTVRDEAGRLAVEGRVLARFAEEHARSGGGGSAVAESSARNRFVGIVTKVTRDGVMAQVEVQAGPHRLVSLMTREAADDLGLEPGVLAVATVKATNVIVEKPVKES